MIYLNSTLEELKTQVAMVLDLMDFPLFLRVMQEEASVLLNVNLENDLKTLKELKLSNGSDIIVNIEEGDVFFIYFILLIFFSLHDN